MADGIVANVGIWQTLFQGTAAIPKALAKLIETVPDQICLFLEPTHIRRIAKAKADGSVFDAQAHADIEVIETKSKLSIRDIRSRAQERTRRKEERRQKNIEKITAQAADEMKEEPNEEPVNPDWVTQFYTYCEDIGNEEMQLLWSRLLAGEVIKPGTFSMRTLAVVKTLDHKVANHFSIFCKCLWRTSSQSFPLIFTKTVDFIAAKYNLSFADLLRLESAGLIKFQTPTGFSVKFNVPPESLKLAYLDEVYLFANHIQKDRTETDMKIGHFLLSDVGEELSRIANATKDNEYIEHIREQMLPIGWTITKIESVSA